MLAWWQAPTIVARSLLVALVAPLIVGCAVPTPTDPPSPGIPLLTQESPATGCDTARTEGKLVRDPRSGMGVRDNRGGVSQVIWPFGYVARDDGGRLALLDATGAVPAHEGDRVAIGGGEAAEGGWFACPGILPP